MHINDVYLALLTGNIRNFNICLSAGQEFKYCPKLVHFTLHRVLATSKLYQRQQLVGVYWKCIFIPAQIADEMSEFHLQLKSTFSMT